MNENNFELENWREAPAPAELKNRAMAPRRHRRGLILIPAFAIAIVLAVAYVALRPSPAMAAFRAAESHFKSAQTLWIVRKYGKSDTVAVIAFGAFRLDSRLGNGHDAPPNTRVYRGPLGRWYFNPIKGLVEDSPSTSTYHSPSNFIVQNYLARSEELENVVDLEDRELDGERLFVIRATYQGHIHEIWTTSRENIPRRIDTFRPGETIPYDSIRLRLDVEIDPKAMTPEGLKKPIEDFVRTKRSN